MMKVGIMQPYFLPYLGYWQLMNAVDCYVILDDAAFIKRGWIHRNRIQNHGQEQWLTLPVSAVSQNKLICELQLARDERTWHKLRRSVQLAYCHAPQFSAVFPMFAQILDFPSDGLADFLVNSIRIVASYLSMDTVILRASELEHSHLLHAQDRILDICSHLGADTYYNAIGGKQLYNERDFAEHGMTLQFVRMQKELIYPQGKGEFHPGLSILDAMMYHDRIALQALLHRFTLESQLA